MAIRRPNLVKWSHRSCALRGSVRRLVSKGSMMRRMIVARVDFPLPCGPINIAIKKGPSDKAAIIVANKSLKLSSSKCVSLRSSLIEPSVAGFGSSRIPGVRENLTGADVEH